MSILLVETYKFEGSPAKTCVCFYILLVDLSFSLLPISQAASAMLKLLWGNVYPQMVQYRLGEVSVPIMVQEQLIIITMMYAYNFPRVLYFRMID